MPEFDNDDKTIFTSDLNPAEKAAVKSGEARGKREYMKEHPRCGLTAVSDKYRENYVRVFGHE